MGNCRVVVVCAEGMRIYSAWGRTTSTPGCSDQASRAPRVEDQAPWVQASHEYKVYHQNDWWHYTVDGVEYHATPEASICWEPKIAVWFGESLDYGDQIRGTSGNPPP